jgi:hypothetical protein
MRLFAVGFVPHRGVFTTHGVGLDAMEKEPIGLSGTGYQVAAGDKSIA